ncbi:unnamed protein product [Oppiella nova]|uniref:Uncharacterized protein n=1 Tax=Oppiella nova TaxID=334625 RepID=A0A7R9MX80_9ACAR|nr:unnamed protein product [Oppiella nova]CAG2184028.1 unnamed protein product [Oppiella nova]
MSAIAVYSRPSGPPECTSGTTA